MPLLRINATATGLRLHDTSLYANEKIHQVAVSSGPAIIMIHGYKYAPASKYHCPHRKILGESRQGWPHKLGFGTDNFQGGTGVALGWYARGKLRKVHKRATSLGEQLASIVKMLRNLSPAPDIHVVAHSLGSEVALSALKYLPANSVNRMILMTGASHQSHALRMLATPAGRSSEVLNVVSRENDLFDAAFEHLVPPSVAGDRAIGQGIAARNVVNLQIDCSATRTSLQSLGMLIEPTNKRVCHWSAYQRQGLMEVYNRFLREPHEMKLSRLAALLPEQTEPRWSKLLSRPESVAAALPDRLPRSLHALAFPKRLIRDLKGEQNNEHAY